MIIKLIISLVIAIPIAYLFNKYVMNDKCYDGVYDVNGKKIYYKRYKSIMQFVSKTELFRKPDCSDDVKITVMGDIKAIPKDVMLEFLEEMLKDLENEEQKKN